MCNSMTFSIFLKIAGRVWEKNKGTDHNTTSLILEKHYFKLNRAADIFLTNKSCVYCSLYGRFERMAVIKTSPCIQTVHLHGKDSLQRQVNIFQLVRNFTSIQKTSNLLISQTHPTPQSNSHTKCRQKNCFLRH